MDRMLERKPGSVDLNAIDILLKSGKKEDCRQTVRDVFDEKRSDMMKSVMMKIYVMMQIYVSTQEFAMKLGVSKEEFLERFGDADSVMKFTDSEQAAEEYFGSMLEVCVDWRSKSAGDNKGESVDKAKEYIGEHFCENTLSLNEVARHVNLAPTYFSTLFKTIEGVNFVDYLNRLRIEKAQELLCCTSKHVTEISDSLGYSDYRYFSRVFKKYTGDTPKNYKNQRKM